MTWRGGGSQKMTDNMTTVLEGGDTIYLYKNLIKIIDIIGIEWLCLLKDCIWNRQQGSPVWMKIFNENINQGTFPIMSLPPLYFSKTQIALSTPCISTFDLSTPVWNFHTGVERSKVEVAIPRHVSLDILWIIRGPRVNKWIYNHLFYKEYLNIKFHS
jgi:hypothetical protein